MKLEIKNFGPIIEGNIETKKVTVLIGNQGSGKSTVAKLLATFAWIEKYVFRRGYSKEVVNEISKKISGNAFWEYHRIEKYIDRFKYYGIKYQGAVIEYAKNKYPWPITASHNNYDLPKITYFPAERSFVSSIKNTQGGQNFNLWSQSLQDFKEIFQEAKEALIGSQKLPINNVEIVHNTFDDSLSIKGIHFNIPLAYSASGFQSFVPMFLVAEYLSKMTQIEHKMSGDERKLFKEESAKIFHNNSLTEEQKLLLFSNLASRINVKRTINIIEEPEQNLFPTSQRSVLNCLLGFNNEVEGNELILTTHSPYILSYLMLAVKAAELREKANGNEKILSKIYEIVPEKAITPMKDVVIYELNDNGTISELKQVYGLPSNDNFLNNELGEVNTLFSELMEIEDLCHE